MAIFDPARCAKFDQVGATALWRGNIPINAVGEFAYHEMREALGFGRDVALIDVSLIDNVRGGERPQWLVELGAYGIPITDFPGGPTIPPQFNQPKWRAATLRGRGVHVDGDLAPGSLVWWQIEGGSNPTVLGPDTCSYNFIGLIDYLGVLRKASGALLYVHCMNGTDRTGAVVAGYAIKHLGMSLDSAFDLAKSVGPAGVMNPDYVELVTAYDRWLKTRAG